MIRASAPYTSGWGSFVLLKMDRVRIARGGSLSTLHRIKTRCVCLRKAQLATQIQYMRKQRVGIHRLHAIQCSSFRYLSPYVLRVKFAKFKTGFWDFTRACLSSNLAVNHRRFRPWGAPIFRFYAVFGKNCSNRLASLFGMGTPSGKSWIHHC